MSKRALILGAAAFLIAAPFGIDLNRLSVHPITAEAAVNVSFDLFFNNLEPYGSWVQTTDHPYVFVPANVGPNWVPYSNGHWIYTDRFGWYFESDEPFASVTYHYGRWAYSDDIGWYWVPGTRWAPAWVVWRRGGGHVGWAPLPPEGTGYAVDANVTVTDVPDRYWVFVPVEQFLAPQLNVVVEFGDRAHDVFAQTEFAGPVVVQNNVIVNNVIDINFIQQQTNQKVVVHQVQEVNDPKQAAPANGAAVKAFVANVEPPKPNIKPTQVVDIKAAKAKQAQGGAATGGAAANAAGGAPASSGGAAAGAVAAGKEGCKPDASGKLAANCTPAGKTGAAANAEVNKPAGGANPGAAGGANAGAAGSGNAGAAASADNCKPNAAGKLPAGCTHAAKTKAGAAANAEVNQPSGATGEKVVNPKEKAAGAAATETGKVTDNGKPKTGAEGQAAGAAGMGNKGCTPEQIKAGAPGCGANGGSANAGAANGAAAVAQEKTGSITKDGAQPEVRTGKAGKPDPKCTPELKKEKKC
jgi:hypothetical protein